MSVDVHWWLKGKASKARALGPQFFKSLDFLGPCMYISISPSLQPYEIQTAIAPALEKLWKQKDERVKEFLDVQLFNVFNIYDLRHEQFFEMKRYDAVIAMDIYKRAWMQCFANSISRLLLPVDGAHAASCEEMATAMSSAEGAAYKGLQQCIETIMTERLLSAEQKATDYKSPDDGIVLVAYLSRVLEATFTALEGLNKQAFLTELGNRLHKGLSNHWQKYTFNPSGGLRLKYDIIEYEDSYKASMLLQLTRNLNH
ncbi:exocyst complex component SEC10-like protein [Tanacetum coccineum]